jgi:acetyl esterase/lipase
MTSRHLIDPELLPMVDARAPVELSLESLADFRVWAQEMNSSCPLPEGAPVSVEDIIVPGPYDSPSVRLRVYRPASANRIHPAIFHIHGGGYVCGTPESMDFLHLEQAVDLECVILSVAYRLPPETPHPGPIEDCYAALKWVYEHASELKIDSTRIGVKGESAGGGMAAALALLARDRGEVPLRFQHLIHPMLDDRTCSTADPHPWAGEYMWTPAMNAFGWSCLLGAKPGSADISLYAAPARAPDLSGLPATFISVGTLDLFLEENMEYARRLTRAGVPVELHVYPGVPHCSVLETSRAMEASRVAIAAGRNNREALRRVLHG